MSGSEGTHLTPRVQGRPATSLRGGEGVKGPHDTRSALAAHTSPPPLATPACLLLSQPLGTTLGSIQCCILGSHTPGDSGVAAQTTTSPGLQCGLLNRSRVKKSRWAGEPPHPALHQMKHRPQVVLPGSYRGRRLSNSMTPAHWGQEIISECRSLSSPGCWARSHWHAGSG